MLGYDYGYELYAAAPQKFTLFYPASRTDEYHNEVDYGHALHAHMPLAWWERLLTIFL